MLSPITMNMQPHRIKNRGGPFPLRPPNPPDTPQVQNTAKAVNGIPLSASLHEHRAYTQGTGFAAHRIFAPYVSLSTSCKRSGGGGSMSGILGGPPFRLPKS